MGVRAKSPISQAFSLLLIVMKVIEALTANRLLQTAAVVILMAPAMALQ